MDKFSSCLRNNVDMCSESMDVCTCVGRGVSGYVCERVGECMLVHVMVSMLVHMMSTPSQHRDELQLSTGRGS